MTRPSNLVTAGLLPLLLVLGLICPAAPAQSDEIDDRVDRINELLADIPTVVVERRGDRVVATGWTPDKATKDIAEAILDAEGPVLDLIGDDIADIDRMVEIDMVIVAFNDRVTSSVGFDFLKLVTFQFGYFDSYHLAEKPSLTKPGSGDLSTSTLTAGRQWGRLLYAGVDYAVDIANATDELVHITARPHLTTLNGQEAQFKAGGEVVFKVTGNIGGNIKLYPWGIDVKVTPTILRTRDPDGRTQVLIDVEAERSSTLGISLAAQADTFDANFDKIQVRSKALLPINETLILSGLYQRESREVRTGVPLLRNIPFIKYFFSNKSEIDDVISTVIFITPREPGMLNEEELERLDWFVERRKRYIEAREKGGEVLRKFKEEYDDWYRPANNRYASHFYLVKNHQIYRELRGEDLRADKVRRDIMTVQSAHELAGRED